MSNPSIEVGKRSAKSATEIKVKASWNTDAQFINDLDPKLIWTNGAINSFLKGNERFLIVASKGMGKTLLMRYKRQLIEDARDGSITIPRNKMSDYVALGGILPKDLIASMRDVKFWQDMWEIAITISVLLNFPHGITENEKLSVLTEINRAHLPATLAADIVASLRGEYHEERVPSSVLVMLLQDSKGHVEQARTITLPILHDLFARHITSACYVFIDSVDQALNDILPEELDVWCAGQCGLMRAAWELSRQNRHVKVYATIRQEAYASFHNTEALNIRGSVLLIEYTKDDLRNILMRAVKHYEGLESIEDFVGVKRIHNGYLEINENVFDYLHRHIIDSPRWLMILGQRLSESRPYEGQITGSGNRARQKIITNLVNRESANQLAEKYLREEMKMFFQGADIASFVNNLLANINSSVLSLANMKRLTTKFLSGDVWTGTHHPFCLLFNLGLLGYVDYEPGLPVRHQVFKKPYEFNWNYEEILPKNPKGHYLLHPCLHHVVQQRNHRFTFNKIRIGDELPWTTEDDQSIANEKIKVFISYSHDDWTQVEKLVETLEEFMNLRSAGHDIWLDRWKLQGGRWIQDQISEGLRESDFLLPVFSKQSLASSAVAVEWKTKFADKFNANDDRVLPVVLDELKFDDLPYFLKGIYAYRYDGSDTTVARIVEDLLFWKSEDTAPKLNLGSRKNRITKGSPRVDS